jgi:hypothetical protein
VYGGRAWDVNTFGGKADLFSAAGHRLQGTATVLGPRGWSHSQARQLLVGRVTPGSACIDRWDAVWDRGIENRRRLGNMLWRKGAGAAPIM